MFGKVSDLIEGKIFTGLMHSIDENFVCPVDSEQWLEDDSGSWNINTNVYIKCDGKCIL